MDKTKDCRVGQLTIRGGKGAQTPNGESREKFPFYFWDTLPY